jgi:hypothetical protein
VKQQLNHFKAIADENQLKLEALEEKRKVQEE